MIKKLVERYPEETLYVIPRVPTLLDNDGSFLFFYAHKNPSDLLQSSKMKGYLLCDLTLNSGEFNPGNLFIPHQSYSQTRDQLNQIVLFKNVGKFEDYTLENVRNSITKQLEFISAKTEPLSQQMKLLNSRPVIIPVKIVLLLTPKKISSGNELKLKSDLQKYFEENKSKLFTVKIESLVTSKDVSGSFSNILLDNVPQSDDSVSEILASLILATKTETLPDMSERKFICPNEETPTICFSDAAKQVKQDKHFKQVKKLFRDFFPSFETSLEIIPNINRMPSNLLKKVKVTGDNSARLEYADDYLGEVRDCWTDFVSKIECGSGILLYDYQNTHLNSILKEEMKTFQFDWLLCSPHSGFTIFEAVRAQNCENVSAAVKNKLVDQHLRQLFLLRLILFIFLRLLKDGNDETLFNWIVGKSRVVIVFCNAASEPIKAAVNLNPNLSSVSHCKLAETYILSLVDLEKFVDENAESFSSFKLLKIGEQKDVIESDCTIGDIFKGNPASDDFETDEKTERASALLAFSYLSNTLTGQKPLEGVIQRPSHAPLHPDQRLETPDPCRFWDIILTPQQKQILAEDRRYQFIIGEPGTGKTSVLLAKACKTALECEEIENIYFAIPSQKTELRDVIEEFVNRHALQEQDPRFKKIKCITFKDIVQARSQSDQDILTWKKLHKSVLIVDELYLESTERLANEDEEFEVLKFADVMFHTKQCWLTNLQAGQMGLRKGLHQKILIPNFNVSSLNILLRSAHHISAFSTSHVHKSKGITMSSARILGCFVSTQTKITLNKIPNSCDDIVKKIESVVNPAFAQSRRIIIFSDRSQYWSNALKGKNLNLTIVSPKSNFLSVPYTGCEVQSVIIITDELPHKVHDKRTFGVLNLGITRAQYEACVLSNEKCYDRVSNFMLSQNPAVERALFDAANNPKFTCKFDEYSKWDNQTKQLATNLLQIAVQTSNSNMFDNIVNQYPGEDGHKPLPIRKILSALDSPKPKQFLDHLKKRIGMQAAKLFKILIRVNRFPRFFPKATEVTDLLDAGISVGHTSLVDWYFNLIEWNVIRNLLLRYKRLLFSACSNGDLSTLQWALNCLSFYELEDLKKTELRSKYCLLFRDEATLLLTLCYATCDLEAVELLFREGFPNELLLDTYVGKNALQYAIEYENTELIKLLLNSPERKKVFISPVVAYGGYFHPAQYAASLGFHGLSDLLQ